MITLIFVILMFSVFGNLIRIAAKLAWGAFSILCTFVLLPGVLIAAFAAGLIYIAFPLLLIAGTVSLVLPRLS